MGNKIKAEIIADSICPRGHRLTTFVLTFPRFILAELNTHRLFSRNSASSRAIPFEKMVKMVQEDPFIPIAWQKDHKGMQGNEYLDPSTVAHLAANRAWLRARDNAVKEAKELNNDKMANVTKQLCNRLLEPFMWHTVILTATEFDNFFELRCPQYEVFNKVYRSKADVCKEEGKVKMMNYLYEKDKGGFDQFIESSEDSTEIDYTKFYDHIGWYKINKGQSEIRMMQLAECMWDTRSESTPKQLQKKEWHIPFGDNIKTSTLKKLLGLSGIGGAAQITFDIEEERIQEAKIKIATARCARVSYLNFEGKDDYEADIKLYDNLLKSGHFSPFEHCARVMDSEEYNNYYKGYLCDNGTQTYAYPESKGWCNNFRGFIQQRHLIENGN